MADFQLPFGVRVAGTDPVDADRYEAVDITARDLLITNGRAREGQLCYVLSDQILYVLKGATNSDWVPVGEGFDLSFPIFQVGIGLLTSVDDVISYVSGTYVLANGTDDTKTGIGFVTEIIDDNNIKVQDTGEIEYITGGLTVGEYYYLYTTDGAITLTKPDNYQQEVAYALAVDKLLVNIEQMYVFEDATTHTHTWLDLTDTPNLYTGQGLKAVRANVAENGLEFFDLTTGGGQVDTVVGGTEISVDATDPVNPIVNFTGTYDNYQSWNLKTNNIQRTTVQSGGDLDLVAGTNITLGYSAGGIVTINASGGAVGGQVDSVIGGTDITVDNTDPVNPIINYTGVAGTGHLEKSGVGYKLLGSTLGSTALGADSIYLGDSMNASDFVSGTNNFIASSNGTTEVSGNFNFMGGDGAYCLGSYNIGGGELPNILGDNNLHSGWNNAMSSDYSLSSGRSNQLSSLADYSSSIGRTNVSTHEYTYIFGEGNETGASHQMVIGKNSEASLAKFIIGDGVDSFNRANIYEIFDDSTVLTTSTPAQIDSRGIKTLVTKEWVTDQSYLTGGPYDNYGSWNLRDGDGTIVTIGAGEQVSLVEGTNIDIDFTDVTGPIYELTISATETFQSLTTTGSSGAATLIGGVLNIPIYAGGSGGQVDSVVAGLGIDVDNTDAVNPIVSSEGLKRVDETNGDGWRLLDYPDANYGNIGLRAVDFSYSAGASATRGATGENAFAIGIEPTASGKGSFAAGNTNVADGWYATALGYHTAAAGNQALSIGSATSASGISSVAGGNSSIANQDYSFAFGNSVISGSSYSFNVGQFNDNTEVNSAFEVGVGTSAIAKATGLKVLTSYEVVAPELTETLIDNYTTGRVLVTREWVENNGGGGQVNTVVGGTDITVDNTDPINPIVNFDGGYLQASTQGVNRIPFFNATTDLVDTNSNFVFDGTAVGIGTQTPALSGHVVKLHVLGSGSHVAGRTTFVVENTSANSASNMTLLNSSGNSIRMQMNGSTYSSSPSKGLISTTATDILFMTDGNSSSGGSSDILFTTGGFSVAPWVIMTSDQKVGIGNVIPSEKLDVTGYVIATGYKIPSGLSTQFLKADGTVDTSTYLTDFTETDPIFVASDVYGVTTADITNWNTAFGWGDHSGLYLPIATQLAQTKSLVAGEYFTSYNAATGLFTSATPPNDNDNDFLDGASFNTTNGIITLSVSSQSDVTVDLDGRYLESVTNGTGISIDITDPINPIITNTSPDQTVVLSQPESVKITGTYPNFSLSLVGDAASPGNSYIYGTNSSGTKSWYENNADIVIYDNATSGLTATDVQAALDEIVAGGGGGGVTSVTGSAPIASSGGTTPNITHSTASGYVHLPSGGSSDQWVKWSSDGTGQWASLPTPEKVFYHENLRMVSPSSGEEGTIFFTTEAITIVELNDVVVGSGSTTWNIFHASARDSGSANALFSSSRTTSSTSGASTTSFDDDTIPLDSWVWLEVVGDSGTINELAVTISYNID